MYFLNKLQLADISNYNSAVWEWYCKYHGINCSHRNQKDGDFSDQQTIETKCHSHKAAKEGELQQDTASRHLRWESYERHLLYLWRVEKVVWERCCIIIPTLLAY